MLFFRQLFHNPAVLLTDVMNEIRKENNSNEQINQLIDGCIKGDRNSQQVLYKMFYGKMLGVCMRYVKDQDEAKDLLQEGFIKVFGHISDFEKSGTLEGWIRRIMVNTSIDFYRKNKKNILKVDSDYLETKVENIEDENDANEYNGLQPKDIMDAVQKLTPVYRTIFNMYVVDGYTHKQIAEQLGINEGTSKSNYFKAKANIRKLLADKIKGVHQ